MTTQTSPLDAQREYVLQLAEDGYSNRAIANILYAAGVHTSERSIRRALKRWRMERTGSTNKARAEKVGIRIVDDTATIVGEPSESLNSPEELLRERGLDPEDWEVKSLTVNEWDSMTSDKATGDNRVVRMKQLKIVCARKKVWDFIMPAFVKPDYRKPVVSGWTFGAPRLIDAEFVAFVGCQQAPYQDQRLHEKFLEFLSHNKPDRGVLMGDTIDLPEQSRHPSNPEWHVDAQESLNSGYLMLRDYVEASPDTKWVKILGNHDERIRTFLINYASKLYGLRPADIPGQDPFRSVWDIRDLLHLDDLGIELIEPDGKYTHAAYNLNDGLAAIHGERVKKDAGASVLAHLDEIRHSCVMAHTHRQGITHKTVHDIAGNPRTVVGMEIGTMAEIKGGLGYTSRPNWQNGWGTGLLWPEGDFKLDLATYVDGKAMWRDQRF